MKQMEYVGLNIYCETQGGLMICEGFCIRQIFISLSNWSVHYLFARKRNELRGHSGVDQTNQLTRALRTGQLIGSSDRCTQNKPPVCSQYQ